MALELRQQLKLTQQLVMTPQLQQAIKLLQLSRLELLDSVQQELMENPVLEESFEEGPAEYEGLRTSEAGEVLETYQGLGEAKNVAEGVDSGAEVARDADWENYLGEFSSSSRQASMRESEVPEEMASFEARLSSKPSLDGHLDWQLRLSSFTPLQVAIGQAVIGNLDDGGYLRADNAELAEETRQFLPDEGAGVTISEEDVETVVLAMQRMDPVGVAARDARECLLVQLEVNGMDEDPVLLALVRDHLEDLEKRRYKPLARKFKISLEQIRDYLEQIRSLDPLPGASYGTSEPYYVSPDAYVFKYDDEFVIMLNEEGLPRLQLNTFYMDALAARSGKEKDYVQEKMRSAVWLMKSLYQRQRTLYKVVESIVRFQREFFEEGVTKLKPLILKDIAEDIEMHESTVSRITTSKYVATPHGTFELKFFFNSALGLDGGGEVGSESVKALIKKMIDAEDSKKPLSDERIAELLKDELKVNIARRTVAKYRTALNIASSSKRKEVF